jgi:hypothetical protein
LKSLGLRLEKELELLTMPTPYEKFQDGAAQRWGKAAILVIMACLQELGAGIQSSTAS